MGYPQGTPGPYAPQGFGQRPPEPNGVTAILAAAISLGTGGLCVFGAISVGIHTFTKVEPEYRSSDAVSLPLYVGLAGFFCLLGGLLLALRTTVGRVFVIVTSVVGLIFSVIQITNVAHNGPGLTMFALVESAVPLAALILAAVPPTGRWIAAKP
ncbi:hypothetical protein ACFXHA_25925 [Nocardia sp. NPDC059240]|uniref:hypothetical protein n=1 Tax=Nocardia sp. NPDC059240 TaxID=3346786 RepID=UPI003695F4F2